ncbi:MAG TPA: hypothetical protein VGU73_09645 [Acidimicrobiia bacterium]|nr:hypothetical protein [Acidimicrobiia bacterium]
MTTNFARYFTTGTRESGKTFTKLTDDAPEWLKTAVREAHQGTLPNDWIYAECRAAVEAVDSGALDVEDEDDDDVHNHADAQVDVYTQELFQWAADFCLTDTFSAAEEEAENMGYGEDDDVSKRLAAIQYAALRHIADTMKQACKATADKCAVAVP